MKAKYLISIVLLLVMLTGCSLPGAGTEEAEVIQLYYGSEGNEDIVFEERQVTFQQCDDRYKVVLEELIAGPEDETLVANIPADTVVYGTIKQKDALLVNLSSEFNNFGGSIAEIVAVGSVVNTLTQFEEINRVKILIEGEELIAPSGNARGFMEPFVNDNYPEEEVILYFSNPNATAVSPETRILSLPKDNREAAIQRVLEALIEGPNKETLSATIPAEVRILSVKIEGKIAQIDFSEEMHTKHWHGAAGESMTINSVVNTLTEFDYIDKVGMTVEGEPLQIEHVILDEPVERNEAMIAE